MVVIFFLINTLHIFSANSYNSTSVNELLSEMVTYALKEYPGNVPWLRLMGDINFGELPLFQHFSFKNCNISVVWHDLTAC